MSIASVLPSSQASPPGTPLSAGLTALRPCVHPAAREWPLGAGEGVLLDGAGGSCTLTPEEAQLVRSMDGTRTVPELVLQDMAVLGRMELARVPRLLERLRAAGLLADSMNPLPNPQEVDRFRTISRDIGGGLVGMLARLARPFVFGLGPAGLLLIGLSGLVAARSSLDAVVPLVSSPAHLAAGMIVLVMTALLGVSWRQLLLTVGLSVGEGSAIPLEFGLSHGIPMLRPGGTARQARLRSRIAARHFALTGELATAGLIAWVLRLGPWSTGPFTALLSIVVATAALFILLDTSPFLKLLGSQLAADLSGIENLTPRSLGFALRTLTLGLVRAAPTPIPARVHDPVPGELRWFAGMACVCLGWLVAFGWVSFQLLTRWVLPCFLLAERAGPTVLGSFLLAAGLLAGTPPLVAGLVLSGWLFRRAIQTTARTITQIGTKLYTPLALVVALALPLACDLLAQDGSSAPIFVMVVGSQVLSALLAVAIARSLKGARQANAFWWLAAYHLARILTLARVAGKIGIVLTPQILTICTAVGHYSFLLLFPFFLFSYLRSFGRFLGAVTLLTPFALTMAHFGFRQGIFQTPEGGAFVSIAGLACNALLSVLTLFSVLDTPLTTFWSFFTGALLLQAAAGCPQLALLQDPAAQENLAFTLGLMGIAGVLTIAGSYAYLLAFRRLLAPGATSHGGPTTEGAALLHGLSQLMTALSGLIHNHLGPGPAAQLLETSDARLKELELLGKMSASEDVPGLVKQLRKVIGEILHEGLYLVGEVFLRRALFASQNQLYWMERELLSFHLFSDVTWDVSTRPITYGLDPDERLAVLRRVPLLSVLSRDELTRISYRFRRRDFSTGELAAFQSQPIEQVSIVLEGELEIILDASDSLRHLGTVRPLEVFGEAGLAARSGYPASYRALRPTVVLTLGSGELEEALRDTPDALARIRTLVRAAMRLARIPLLADLTTNQLMLLALRMKDHTVDSERPITVGGETARLYLVQEGAVELTGDDERKLRVDTGDWFGELALLGKEQPKASVAAIAPAQLLSIGAEDFRAALHGALAEVNDVRSLSSWRLFRTRLGQRC